MIIIMNRVILVTKNLLFISLFFVFASPGFAARQVGMPIQSKTATISGSQRACLAREAAVKKRMTQLSQLVANQYRVFDRNAARVQDYYTNTVLPSGRTVSNYAALVNDIAAKKVLVDEAVTEAKNSISAFSCASGNPRTLMNDFRINMQSVKTALKNYRTTIRNLIVAVRGLNGESITPTPTI